MGEPLVLEKFSRHIPSLMMKYLLIALAITAISAEILDEVAPHDDTTSLIDEFLENDMQLPCTPKACKPVCKLVTKYVQYGAYKLPYEENVCEPDKKCLADAAACIAKLQAAMKAAEAAEKDMIAKAKLANAAKATKSQKDAAAAAKKKEEAAAAAALAAAKAAFEAAEKEAAAANAASISAASSSKNKNADMAKALAKYEAVKKLHLQAQAAYAEAVKYIGHPQHEVKTCRNGQAKPPAKGPVKPAYKFLFNGCPRGGKATSWKNKGNYPKTKCEQMCTADPKCNLIEVNGCNSRGSECGINCYHFYGSGSDVRNGKCVTNGDQRAYSKPAAKPVAKPAYKFLFN